MSSPQSVIVLHKAVHDGLPAAVDVVEGGRFTGQLLADIFSQEDVLEMKERQDTSGFVKHMALSWEG